LIAMNAILRDDNLDERGTQDETDIPDETLKEPATEAAARGEVRLPVPVAGLRVEL